MIGIINAAMFGTEAAPGEHVDWSSPDYLTRDEWRELLGVSVEEYAEAAPHMIVFEAAPKCVDCGSEELSGPDFEGFYDCRDCGAAWIPEGSDNV